MKPYLKQGENEIRFLVIVGGGGTFYSRLEWDYSKCTEFNHEWTETEKRDVSIYDNSKEETCKQSKPEECVLDGEVIQHQMDMLEMMGVEVRRYNILEHKITTNVDFKKQNISTMTACIKKR